MKKLLPWIALLLCAGLLAAVIIGIFGFIKLTKSKQETVELLSVEEYFAESWQGFALKSCDDNAGTIVLEKQLNVTYEQACAFGKDSYEELALGHVETMQIMRAGCMAECGVNLHSITVNGISSDGQVIYTVKNDGSLTACWD